MLSRAARAAFVSKKPSILYRCVATSSSNSAAATNQPSTEHKRYPHDAPERDFVNFPPPRMTVEPGKLRIGFVPDDWFKAMYDKTGVTGPYILFWGGIATLLSKEYFVYWADTFEHLVFLGLVVFVAKKYGPTIGSLIDKKVDEETAAIHKEFADKTKGIEGKIHQNEALQTLPDASKLIHAAKRENIALQIEASYRQRLAQLYQEVKRRLDYQLAVQNVYKRLEKQQAINYILNQVNSSIGPNQEKEAFQTGLGQLRALSQKYAGTI
jgi:F-type H+-transporting ATPase subunit b